jgi:hypothetical protein
MLNWGKLPNLVILCLTLTGCGYAATREARAPQGADSLIGHNVADIIECAGIPDKVQRIMPDAAIASWSYKDTSPAFKLALLGVSLQVGTAGSCSMTAVFLRDGTVADVSFPQCAGTLQGGPYAAARPLVAECLNHPNDIALPSGYDALVNLGVK